MDDAKQWLQEKGVPTLMEEGIKALVEHKPEDPALFLSQFYAKQHEKMEAGTGRGGAEACRARKGKPNIAIAVPEAGPEPMNPSNLAVILRGGGSLRGRVTVVDVRHDWRGGHIKNSLHITSDAITQNPEKYAQEWKTCAAIVFASAQSPDLDMTAAVPVMQTLITSASSTSSSSTPKVYTLFGGIAGWLATYSGDPALTEGYDALVWERGSGGGGRATCAAAADPETTDEQLTHAGNGGGGRRPSARNLHVTVPDAPQRISSAGLAVIIHEEHSNSVIVDTRPEQVGGSIMTSLHVPVDQVLSSPHRFAEQWEGKDAVIFTSTLSPDLDLSAAVPVLQCLKERGSTAQVFILLDGLRGFLTQYAEDPALVTGYDEQVWRRGGPAATSTATCSPPAATAQQHPSKKKTSMPLNIHVNIPDAPLKMGRSELATLIRGGYSSPRKSSRYVIIDVREPRDVRGGKICGSTYIPCEQFLKDVQTYARTYKSMSAVIFTSNLSPDLDETCAAPFLHSVRELKGETDVFLLLEGIKGWVEEYHDNPVLVQDYDPDVWNQPVSFTPVSVERQRQGAKKRLNVLDLHIGIPESPQKLPPHQLELLLRSGCKDSFVVVDVRPVVEKGVIASAVRHPCDNITANPAKYAAMWSGKDSVIFVSQQSPDLDSTAATSVLGALRDMNATTEVFLLLGGMAAWLSSYGNDESLTLPVEDA